MARQFDQQFFVREDVPVEGPLRELVGYGEHPPCWCAGRMTRALRCRSS